MRSFLIYIMFASHLFGGDIREIADPDEDIISGDERHAVQKELGDKILGIALKNGLKIPDLPDLHSPVSFGTTKESLFEIIIYGKITQGECMEIASKVLILIKNSNIKKLDLKFYLGVKEDRVENNVKYVKFGLISRFRFENFK